MMKIARSAKHDQRAESFRQGDTDPLAQRRQRFGPAPEPQSWSKIAAIHDPATRLHDGIAQAMLAGQGLVQTEQSGLHDGAYLRTQRRKSWSSKVSARSISG